MDAEAVRRALPFQPGDAKTGEIKPQARDTAKRITGRDATEVAFRCCDPDGDTYVFIGLAGESSRRFATNPEPKGRFVLRRN